MVFSIRCKRSGSSSSVTVRLVFDSSDMKSPSSNGRPQYHRTNKTVEHCRGAWPGDAVLTKARMTRAETAARAASGSQIKCRTADSQTRGVRRLISEGAAIRHRHLSRVLHDRSCKVRHDAG